MATPSGTLFSPPFYSIESALTHGYYWTKSYEQQWQPVTLTVATYDNGPYTINAASAQSVFSSFSSTITSAVNIQFNFVGHFSDFDAASAAADITFGFWDLSGGALGVAFFPDPAYGIYAGSVGLDSSLLDGTWTPGTREYFVGFHELGHALGLKHPHDDGGTGHPTFADLGLSLDDQIEFVQGDGFDVDWLTVMSYNDDLSFLWEIGDPATFMPLDTYALQQIYGANRTTNAGDTSYSLTHTDSYRAIWDAGGTDTISVSDAQGGWVVFLGVREDILPDVVKPALAGWGLAYPYCYWQNPASPDTIAWFYQSEHLNGTAFGDELYGSRLNNQIFGLGGNDVIAGWDGNDTLAGGAGNDTLEGGDGLDVFLYSATGNGIDTIVDFSGGDAIEVPGANFLGSVATGNGSSVGINQIQLAGGSGVTTLYFGTNATAGSDITINLYGNLSTTDFVLSGPHIMLAESTTAVYQFTGSYLNIPNFQPGDTVLIGSASIGVIQPSSFVIKDFGAGVSLWNSTLGSGIFLGGIGMAGVSGDALQFYDGTSYQLGLIQFGDGTSNTVEDTLANDITAPEGKGLLHSAVIFGLDGADTLTGSSGNDFLQGNQGNDDIFGGTGNDTIRGGKNDDYIDGWGGDDQVFGDLGNDTVFGWEGDDLVRGGRGNDVIYGEAGDDVMMGDRGDDVVIGGDGYDIFVFSPDSGIDTIDYNDFYDFISVSGYGITSFSQLTMFQIDLGVMIDFGPTAETAYNQVLLHGTNLNQMDSGDFFFS